MYLFGDLHICSRPQFTILYSWAQEANVLYLFGGHCVEVHGKEETEIVYNDLWRLDLKSYKASYCCAS